MHILRSSRLWIAVVAAAALVGLMHGQPGQGSPPAERIRALVGKLGDPQFRIRARAGVELKKIGEPALPALYKAAANTKEAEVRLSARRLIDAILLAARTSKSTGMELVDVKPGVFQMGSPGNETGRSRDEQSHRVELTKRYLIGKSEVTQDQYRQVMKANPSWFSKTGTGAGQVAGKTIGRFPVEEVTWYDAIAFCNQLSKMDGHKPYYSVEKIERKASAIVKAEVKVLGGNGYRLPTEAEWEYACRAGTTSRFHYGVRSKKTHANLKSVYRRGGYGIRTGWQSLGRTARVGSYPANAWGLLDMHGNVAEWCWDNYDKDYYIHSRVKDPQGPPSRYYRVLRGGSWLVYENSCRSACRFWMSPSAKNFSTGFRVARTP